MVWQKNGTPDTLTIAGDVNEVTDLSGLKTNFMLNHQLNSGQLITGLRINNVSATDYARRFSTNGGADGTDINSNQFSAMTTGADSFDEFCVGYINGISSQEKLGFVWVMGRGTAGAANAPTRRENANKWVDTSNTVNELNVVNTGTGDLAIDTNLSVLGDVVPAPAAVGGWVELARTTLGSGAQFIDVSSLPDKRYYMILGSALVSGSNNITMGWRYGNSTIDSGSNYANRYSANGASDVTEVSNTFSTTNVSGGNPYQAFDVGYIANLSGQEKLIQTNSHNANTAGAANAPRRTENVSKWVNTSNPIDIIRYTNERNVVNIATGSEAVVLGWDPTDTHTNNFWEELASVELTSAATTIDSGTITAKKYLWVQYYVDRSSTDQPFMTFNSDSASNYSERISLNGAADSTQVSQTNFEIGNGAVADNPQFGNMFIINNSANEKLVIQHTAGQQGAAASIAPRRVEMVSKWANTAAQITNITLGATAGNYNAPSFLKIWGSD